ncbi:MAG: hypothetical protein H0V17_24890, partial [Deltaproteobacteria bacterium]|nr:hypothetical protein [Deltaproteobacteria bacterium]
PEPAPAPAPSALAPSEQAPEPAAPAVFGVDAAAPLAGNPEAGRVSESIALQVAISAEPLDAGPQLVLADLLLADDDPRGELIVLHHRETTEALQDPEALERYLLLAAYFSFPCALPEAPTLPFVARSERPVHYVLTHDASDYDLHYRNRTFELRVNGRNIYRRRLQMTNRSAWTTAEAALILRHVSEAIRAGAPLISLQLPFVPDPLPTYDGGPVRSYGVPLEFTRPRGLAPSALGLAARDYARWIALWRRLAKARAGQSQMKPAAGPSAS